MPKIKVEELEKGMKNARISPDPKAVTDVLTADIADMFFDNRELKHTKEDKEEIRMLFETYIKSNVFALTMMKIGELEVVDIAAFGSSATPMACQNGDLDLCIWVKPKENSTRFYGEKEVKKILRALFVALIENKLQIKLRRYTNPIMIASAKVPIVKVDIYDYSVDISVHIGERESTNVCVARLFSAYHLFNPNFSALVCYVKEWFKQVIRNDPNSHSAETVLPNSYAITILIAQFLIEKGMLPNLLSKSKDKFLPSNKPMKNINGLVSSNEVKKFKEKTVFLEPGVLLCRFIDYLATEVDFKNNALLVESATFVSRESQNGLFKSQQELVIIDCFDRFNPGRRVMSIDGFVAFLREAKSRIENAHNPHRINERLKSIRVDYKLIARLQRTQLSATTDEKITEKIRNRMQVIEKGHRKTDGNKKIKQEKHNPKQERSSPEQDESSPEPKKKKNTKQETHCPKQERSSPEQDESSSEQKKEKKTKQETHCPKQERSSPEPNESSPEPKKKKKNKNKNKNNTEKIVKETMNYILNKVVRES